MPEKTFKILVTGANGFIGKNLIVALRAQRPACTILPVDIDSAPDDLENALATADFIFHLAGVNRPRDEREFQTGNTDFTARICKRLLQLKRSVPLVLSSSTQALLDNPYGLSKLGAEKAAAAYSGQSGARVKIYRLKNVFGKWCRPNYNSVTATFCHNIARDLPVTISDPDREIELVYIDDVIKFFLRDLEATEQNGVQYVEATPIHKVTLGALEKLIRSFRQMRTTLHVPDFTGEFARKLYGTYLACLAPDDFAYALEKKQDNRGCLAEFVKSLPFGQIFVSRTRPGVTRGNHYHDTKTEKFLVVSGKALIRFRHALNGRIIEYRVAGADLRVLDIPPGYTHSIENIGREELVTLFWTAEVFDPAHLDTKSMPVLPSQ